ncbi:MAG: DUF2256 domain-containing protein [Pseudohongiellaceae bacterium]
MPERKISKARVNRLPFKKLSKNCRTCGKAFTWRKKWRRDWENVRYCSERCKRSWRTGRDSNPRPPA